MAVTAPTLTPLPPAPLPTDAEAVFDAKAGASLTAQASMVVELNATFGWVATQVNAAEGYATTASQAATSATNSAAAADVSRIAAQSAAAAAGSAIGLPSLIGNGRRALAVLPNESGVSFQSQIKALYIEPLLKTNVTGAVSLDVGVSGFFNLTLTGNVTLTFANLPTLSATETLVVLVRANQGATAYGITFPASIVWMSSGGTAPGAPAASRSGEYLITFEGGQVFGRKGSGT